MKTLVFIFADGCKKVLHCRNGVSPWDLMHDFQAVQWYQA